MLNFKNYLERVAIIENDLEGLEDVCLGNNLMTDKMYCEFGVYKNNPFKISGNINTPLFNDTIVARIINDEKCTYDLLNKILFPISVGFSEDEHSIVNQNIKVTILADITRRRLIEGKLNSIYRQQREALSNENVANSMIMTYKKNNFR